MGAGQSRSALQTPALGRDSRSPAATLLEGAMLTPKPEPASSCFPVFLNRNGWPSPGGAAGPKAPPGPGTQPWAGGLGRGPGWTPSAQGTAPSPKPFCPSMSEQEPLSFLFRKFDKRHGTQRQTLAPDVAVSGFRLTPVGTSQLNTLCILQPRPLPTPPWRPRGFLPQEGPPPGGPRLPRSFCYDMASRGVTASSPRAERAEGSSEVTALSPVCGPGEWPAW